MNLLKSTFVRSDDGLGDFSNRYAIYALVILGLAVALDAMDSSVLSILLPNVKMDFRLSDGQIGMLGGVALAVNAALSIPVARIADVRSRKHVLAFAVGVWSVMTMLCGAAGNFALLLTARAGVGVGQSGATTPCYSLVCDLVRPEKRSGAFSILIVGAALGSVLGLSLGGLLVAKIGWRLTLVVLGAPGIIIALGLLFAFREPRRGRFDHAQEQDRKISFLDSVRGLLSRPSFVHLTISAAILGMTTGITVWFPTYLMRSFGASSAAIGASFGLAIGAGGLLGSVASGFLGNRAMDRDLRWGLWLPTIFYVASLPILLACLLAQGYILASIMYFVFILIATIGSAPLLAVRQLVARPNERTLAAAITILATGVLGSGGGPWLVGHLSDLFAKSGHAQPLRDALLCSLVFPAWAFVHLWLAARSLRADVRAASGIDLP